MGVQRICNLIEAQLRFTLNHIYRNSLYSHVVGDKHGVGGRRQMGWYTKEVWQRPKEAQLRFFWSLVCSQTGYCGGDECSLGRDNPRAWGIGKENLTRGVFICCPHTLVYVEGLDGLAGAPLCLLPPPEGVLTSLLPTGSLPPGADVPQGCPEGSGCQLQAAPLNGKAPNDPTCKPCSLQQVK